jgi:hypothetical protein
MTSSEGSLTGRNNGRGGGEVRLSDFQVNDIMSRRL